MKPLVKRNKRKFVGKFESSWTRIFHVKWGGVGKFPPALQADKRVKVFCCCLKKGKFNLQDFLACQSGPMMMQLKHILIDASTLLLRGSVVVAFLMLFTQIGKHKEKSPK